MAIVNDAEGLYSINALGLQGATKYIGTSANVAAFNANDGSAVTFSFTNYSINSDTSVVAINSAESNASDIAACLSQLITELANQGIVTISYDGT